MKCFEKMMVDLFSNPDFLEQCYINGYLYDCFVTNIENGVVYSDSGLEEEEAFTLDIQRPFKTTVKVNDKVKFRDKMYKISNIVDDSAFTSTKLYLIALSKGIGA